MFEQSPKHDPQPVTAQKSPAAQVPQTGPAAATTFVLRNHTKIGQWADEQDPPRGGNHSRLLTDTEKRELTNGLARILGVPAQSVAKVELNWSFARGASNALGFTLEDKNGRALGSFYYDAERKNVGNFDDAKVWAARNSMEDKALALMKTYQAELRSWSSVPQPKKDAIVQGFKEALQVGSAELGSFKIDTTSPTGGLEVYVSRKQRDEKALVPGGAYVYLNEKYKSYLNIME